MSRADLLAELRDPSKAEAWSLFTHYWWLVLPDTSLLRPHDTLPDGWGVMVAHGRALRVVTQATRRDPQPMDTARLAGLLRATQQTEGRVALAGVQPPAPEPEPDVVPDTTLAGLESLPGMA